MTIYLYHKHCSHCGLKYFGRTVKDDPYKYTGSGVHWKRHIKKYGEKNVITDWIKAFDNQEECTKFALAFSHDNNIVESTDWANVIVEDGKHRNDMSGFKHSVETKSQISESQKGRVGGYSGHNHSIETRQRISVAGKGKTRSAETRVKMSENNRGTLGKKLSDETKRKMSEAGKRRKSRPAHTDETKRKISESAFNRHKNQKRYRIYKEDGSWSWGWIPICATLYKMS